MSEEIKYTPNTGTLIERLAKVKPLRWVRFSVVALIYILWTIWLGSWWVILFLPLLADIYLTQFIPWTSWKGCKNSAVRMVMSWVDAILYALILVYFIFAYFGQNYQIPSSSLEKSLLVGDYLWVNKMIYGPRVPMTPLHFPLTQNTLPFGNVKSYIDTPQWDYHRLKGYRNIERNDIVVFNFPAGDTVALKVQNPDYYTLVEQYGREAIWNNKETFGEVIYRPVDRRENYVKRAIGLPGERLKIKNNVVYINGNAIKEPLNVQYNYLVQTDGSLISDRQFDELEISLDDRHLLQINHEDAAYTIAALGLQVNENNTINPIYQLPLTAEMVKTLSAMAQIKSIIKVPVQEMMNVYPINRNYNWTRADYGEIWIPRKGVKLHLTLDNLPIYERAIRNYEGNSLEIKEGKILINGTPTDSYRFKMDYYWMMGDNRDNSADSRYWGFVPEDHVVGSPMFVIVSLDKDKNLFNGGIRWNRIFKSAISDKD
ncbi:MAG: signal peptidase I [Muribaculaceae bacterium]|nr:signal peptidase I [Muribaculaceae bacterium]